MVIPAAVLLVIALSVLVSVLAYVLAFWGFRLVRRADGALHTSRGLISTVAATIERKRVRGVQLHEPVLMRLPGGAKLRAIATGTDRNPTLLPPAPRAEAVQVADKILGRPGAVEVPLTGHGPVAVRRRYTRALAAAALPAVAFAALAVGAAVIPDWWALVPAAVALVLLVGAVGTASVRARHLGSATNGSTVSIGAPTLARTRTVLEFDGVTGFVTRESFFQRRAGVATLTVATAAGAFGAVDVTPERAAELARTVQPEIVTGFLVSEA